MSNGSHSRQIARYFHEFERRQREATEERKREKYLKQTRTFCSHHHDDILISVVGSSSPFSIVFRFLTSLHASFHLIVDGAKFEKAKDESWKSFHFCYLKEQKSHDKMLNDEWLSEFSEKQNDLLLVYDKNIYIFKNVADGSDEGNELFVLNKIADFWASPAEVLFSGR